MLSECTADAAPEAGALLCLGQDAGVIVQADKIIFEKPLNFDEMMSCNFREISL